jgi:mevalonate kinase
MESSLKTELEMDQSASRSFKKFYAKILLFGEYTVLSGGSALALPFEKLSLVFTFEKQALSHRHHLLDFYNKLEDNEEQFTKYDLTKFKVDIDAGLDVISNIPIGYGVGSSGALVAAFYEEYCTDKIIFLSKSSSEDYNKLKSELASLENLFHGASSGLDPFISFTNHPFLSQELFLTQVDSDIDTSDLFILDSGISRSTETFVKLFKSKEHWHSFDLKVTEMKELNNECIDKMIHGKNFKENFLSISKLQYELMPDFIPDGIKTLWKEGIDNESFYLKLCGAGGGGFYLGLDMKKEHIFEEGKVVRF